MVLLQMKILFLCVSMGVMVLTPKSFCIKRDRPVPMNIRGFDSGIDVAHFGSRFVPTYTAKIRHQSRPVEPRGDGSIDVKNCRIIQQKRIRIMLYFTSDLHLGHENAIEFTKRPFKSIDEMNNTLIENINAVVGEKDELWILGDFSYKLNKEQVCQIRQQIKCRHVHLVYGNHDKDYSQEHIFQSVQHYKELKTEYGRIVLFHYPILEWNAAHYGTIHLHGHIHSTGEYNSENLQKFYRDRFPSGHAANNEDLRLRIYDVGIDANQFKPISLAEIANRMGVSPAKDTRKCTAEND